MPAQSNDGSLSFAQTLDNSDYKAKILESIGLTDQLVQATLKGSKEIDAQQKQFAAAVESQNNSLLNTSRAAANIADTQAKAISKLLNGAGSGQTSTNTALSQTNSNLQQTESLAEKAAFAVGSFLSIQAAKNFVEQLISVRGEFEQIEIAYSTILKSKPAADQLLGQAKQLAITTPFSFQEIATAGKQLLAYGVDAKDVIGTIRTLGDVAAGVSAPLGDIAYLYGTLKTQGRAYAQDIRQFTGRGIPIIAELAKQFGVTESNVQNLVEAGKVGFPEVEKAFKSLTSAGGQFYNLTEAQSKSLTGQLSNLKDAFQFMLNDLGKANEGFLSGGIAGVANIIQNYQKVADIIGELIIVYGSYRAALITTNALDAARALVIEAYGIQMANLTALELLQVGALNAINAAQVALNAVMKVAPTLALTAALSTLISVFYALREANQAEAEILNQSNKIREDAAAKVVDEKTKLQELVKVATDRNSTNDQQIQAIVKLNQISPEYLGGLNAQNVATAEGTKAINAYLKSLDDKAKGEAAYAQKLDNNKKILDLQSKGSDSLGTFDKLGEGLKDFFSGKTTFSSGDDAAKTIVNNRIKLLQDSNKKIDELYGAQLKAVVTGTTKVNSAQVQAAIDFENLAKNPVANLDKLIKTATNQTQLKQVKDNLQEKLNALAPNDPQIEVIKGKLTKLNGVLAQYDLSADKRVASAAESEFKKRQTIYDKIGDLQQQALSDAKTANQKEVDDVKEKYSKILRQIDEYNRKAKVKIDPTNINIGGKAVNIKTEQKNAIDSVIGKQTVEASQKDIDAQKQIFDQFEQYKLDFGVQKANERFAADLKGYKTFIEYLQSLVPKQSDQSAGANAMRDYLKTALPKAQQEASKKAFDQQSKDLKAVLDQTKTAATERLRIETQYQKDLTTLSSDKSLSNSEFNDRAQVLEDNRKRDLLATKQLAFEESAIYKDAMADLTYASLEEIKKRIKAAKDEISKADLTPEQRAAANLKLNNAQRGLDALGFSQDQYGQTIKNFDKISEKAKEVQAYSEATAGSFHELGDALTPFNAGLGDTLNTIGDLAAVAGNAAGSFASFASGDIVGGITKGISAIAGVFKIFSAAKESAKKAAEELQKFQDDLLRNEIAYNELIRQRARTQEDITKLTIDELKARQDLLKAQTSSAQADYDRLLTQIQSAGQQITGYKTTKSGGFLGIGAKSTTSAVTAGIGNTDYENLLKLYTEGKLTDATKTWFEALQKVHDEMGDITDAAAAAKDQLDQVATGTTADAIASSLIDGFKKGFRTFDDFAADSTGNFQSLLQGALDSTFASSYLKKKVADFYDEFAKASENGLDDNKIAALKAEYAKLIADAGKVYDDQSKIFGTATATTAAASSNSLAGAVKGITQDQASIIAGALNGGRVAQLETNNLLREQKSSQLQYLDIAMGNLRVLNQIEANTRSTAGNTADSAAGIKDAAATLKSIDSKQGSSLDIQLRAAGKFNY